MARAAGRQEAVSSRRARVFSWFEGCLVACFVCLRPLNFFIRFRSDVWYAVLGCFPDLKGVLWLVLCAWNNCLPDP